jgi:hypothetical protein
MDGLYVQYTTYMLFGFISLYYIFPTIVGWWYLYPLLIDVILHV